MSPESRRNLDYEARLRGGTAGPGKSEFAHVPKGYERTYRVFRLVSLVAPSRCTQNVRVRRFVSLRPRQRGPATVCLSLDGICVARLLGQGSVIYRRAKKVYLLLLLSVLLLSRDLARLPILRMRLTRFLGQRTCCSRVYVRTSFLDSYVRCSDSGRYPSRTRWYCTSASKSTQFIPGSSCADTFSSGVRTCSGPRQSPALTLIRDSTDCHMRDSK